MILMYIYLIYNIIIYLQFYILDDTLECIARHILFLIIFFDNNVSIPERVQLYLELYGNVLLRSKTKIYLDEKINEILNYMSGNNQNCILNEILDLSLYKYKERDEIENIFKFWKIAKVNDFDIVNLRFLIFILFILLK